MMQVDRFVLEKIKYFIGEQLITISVIGACKNLNILRKHVNFPELDSSVGQFHVRLISGVNFVLEL
jgi:hypothetical protein